MAILTQPRLYFHAEDLPELRDRFERDDALRQARDNLLVRAEEALKTELLPETAAMEGSAQHGNYQRAGGVARGVIEPCSFAYAVTENRRFADRAVEAMRHFSTYDSWTGRMFQTWDPPWHSALETATFTQTFAAGIDWLGDALSDADRRTACEALARLGVAPLVGDWIGPEGRVHALDSMGHNWWMVCVAAAGVGALCLLGEDDRAEGWVKRIVEGIPEFFRYPGNVLQNKMRTFDPDGGFYESLGYTNYTLVHYAYLMAALRHMFPEGLHNHRFDQLAPELDRMDEFMLHFLYPCGQAARRFLSVDFGDQNRASGFSGDVTLFLAKTTGNGRYRWVFDRCSDGVSGPYQMLFYDPDVHPQPPDNLPTSRALCGIGWAALRDAWDDDATLLAVKCGDTWNHAHADAGSFVVWAGGEPLLIDSGSCSYGRREYRAYYTESQAHNVVRFNGEGPASEDQYRGSKFPGKLYAFSDDADARYVLADATGPFAVHYRRFLRHFLWLDGAIVMVDDLLAHQAGRFEWLFHGEKTPAFEDQTLRIQGDAASLEMSVLFPTDLKAVEREGYTPRDPDRVLNYLALQQQSEAIDTKFLGIIRAGRPLPDMRISSRQGSEWIGARLVAPAWQWDLYCNLRADGRRMHRNSNLEMAGWETDAFLLGLREGDRRRTLLIGGSYLRDAEATVCFDCLSQCNALVTYGADGKDAAEIRVQAPPGSRVRVRSDRGPLSATANGQAVAPEAIAQDKGYQVIPVAV